MANISSMVEIDWFFGLAFNESTVQERSSNVPLAVHWAQSILGARLRGLSLGNEPDL
jgi:hypothetical protein